MRYIFGFLFLAASVLPAFAGWSVLNSDPIIFRQLGTGLNLQTPAARHEWLLIRPVLRAYDNVTRQSPGTVLPLTYRLSRLFPSAEAELGPALDRLGPGTVYLAAWEGTEPFPRELQSKEALHIAYPRQIIQIVTRGGDTYLDYLHELSGTPFIMGPGVIHKHHQTDERQGSDCAALATYGRRRMGYQVAYGGPRGILDYLRPLSPCLHPDHGGVYRDSQGDAFPISGMRPGDILHFAQQVSVFVEDQGKLGVLDVEDIVFESWGETPREIAISQSDFTHLPLQVYRWKDPAPGSNSSEVLRPGHFGISRTQ